MDLRKFERVWEKAGERPEGLAFEPMPIPRGGWWLKEPHSHAESVRSLIHETTAAAIIRDWAVGWLLDCVAPEILIWGSGPGRTLVNEWGDHEVGRQLADGDRTEALYLACCKVLGIEV